MSDQRDVLRLLYRRRAQHREAGRARRHHVGVIAEDRQRVRGDRSRGNVDHRGRQLAGDLEHVRDHQQQPLRGGERGRQRAPLERAVERAGGAGLALHLDHVGHGAPKVRTMRRAPGIGQLAHRRRRRDRVDRDHLAELVGHLRRGLVAVDADPVPPGVGIACHCVPRPRDGAGAARAHGRTGRGGRATPPGNTSDPAGRLPVRIPMPGLFAILAALSIRGIPRRAVRRSTGGKSTAEPQQCCGGDGYQELRLGLQRGIQGRSGAAGRQGRQHRRDVPDWRPRPGSGRLHRDHRGLRGLHERRRIAADRARRADRCRLEQPRAAVRQAARRQRRPSAGVGALRRPRFDAGHARHRPQPRHFRRCGRGLAERTGDERFAWDCYRRFVQMYGNVVRGIDGGRLRGRDQRVQAAPGE